MLKKLKFKMAYTKKTGSAYQVYLQIDVFPWWTVLLNAEKQIIV